MEKLVTLNAIQSIRAAGEAATHDQPIRMPSGARTEAPDAARIRTVNPFCVLLGAVLAIALLAGPVGAQQTSAQAGGKLPERAVRQIEALLAQKAQRTPAQRKVSSQLLDAGGSAQFPEAADADAVAEPKLVTVDIRADVTPAVLARIRALRGTVINSVPKYRAIRAQLPLAAVEPLAGLAAVQTIRPADEAFTRAQAQGLKSNIRTDVLGAGGIHAIDDTSEGDVAHQANLARTTHGVDGSGIGIGVLSDGVGSFADRQASGDLPARVTVLPGQAGLGDEGTAMLEIVHDLAPGAELYFATALGGQAQYAANIEALCEAGADVIVDDVAYFLEAAFQDDIVAQGINSAVADGCVHFSAAGNNGNLNDGTSGVWEGDYTAGSSLIVDGETVGVRHVFGDGEEENSLGALYFGSVVLQWTDPLGTSANDYDLFLIDEDGDVVAKSTDTQDGTQDPIEYVPSISFLSRAVQSDLAAVVVKFSGADRYLRLHDYAGQLEIATAGNTVGHSAAENAVGVAAVDVRDAGSGNVFNGTESVETYSSDGPRRIFFQVDSTAITPGDFSSSGGRVVQKPDLAAATCVSTATPGFSPFCGTSSAAPHAAAIAALMLEAAGGPNQVTPAQLSTAMTGAALDIEATGVDRDSGAGIVMAPGAVDAVDVAVADRNGAPTVVSTVADRTFAPGAAAVTIDMANVFDDPDDDTLDYRAVSSDPDRLAITRNGSQLTITPGSPGRVVVRLRAIDPDGLSATETFAVTVTVGNRDYDADNDGLIDVANLAQLDALRYDLNGDGLVDGTTWMPYYSAFPMGALGMGCPDAGCRGYELTVELDFDTNASGGADSGDTYWNDGKGWAPIGNQDDPFTTSFDGNGHSLTNLFMNRPDQDGVGLFGQFGPVPNPVLGSADEFIDLGHDLLDVGLIGVNITGRDQVGSLIGRAVKSETRRAHASGRVAGRDQVGGLVGDSEGGVWESYAAVQVAGRNSVGGLVGNQSATTAFINPSWIAISYATGDVTGTNAVGGLVGSSANRIITTYATGNVSGTGSRGSGASECELGGGGVGGLVGNACDLGIPSRIAGGIFASYARGTVSGEAAVGGLVGTVHSEFIFLHSYWDLETSGVRAGLGQDDRNDNGVIDGTESHSLGLAGQTTAVLQAPTNFEGIYKNWNLDRDFDDEPDEYWHFGTSSQYPVLAVDLDQSGSATWQEFGYQVRTGLTLTATTTEGQTQVVLNWTAVSTSPWSPAPDLTYTLVRDDGTTEEAVAEGITARQYTDTDLTIGNTYTYRVAALLDGGEAVRSRPVSVIVGVANQPPVTVGIMEDLTLRVGGDTQEVDVSGAFQDPESDTLTYGASSSATSVATVGVSAAQLMIAPVAIGRSVVTVTATDTAGSNTAATQRFTVTVWPADAVDYDSDADGLIEIATLGQLNAVRHDLDGDGIPTAEGTTSYEAAFAGAVERMGCGLPDGCEGYELAANLDFDTNGNGEIDSGDDYWNGGEGWVPIGGGGTTATETEFSPENPFQAIFDGNGHSIRNFFIDTDTLILAGFFGYARYSNIRNLGLIDVDVTSTVFAAGLVGYNAGVIRGTYVTGVVSGDENVGGLVGINRQETGLIRGSYSTSHVSGDDDVGGLVGDNRGEIAAGYATGRVSGDSDVGGLVGNNKSTGEIVASYATGRVSGNSEVGGLVGLFEGGDITAGYWDTSTSGHSTGVLPFGRTTAQLQSPGSYTGIYESWNLDLDNDDENDDPWDFGTDAQYPALKADFDESGTATWQEFGYQLREGPTLMATAGPAQAELSWTAVETSHWTPAPAVTYTLYRDDGATLETLGKGLSGLTFTDTDVTAGTTYTYQVAAVVQGGEATRSALVEKTAETTALPNMWLNPPESDPVAAVKSAATYSVTFQGAWTTTVTTDGLPSGAHFTTLIGGVHNAGVTFLREGGMASAGVEFMAELGGTSTLAAEVRAAEPTALSVLQGSGGNIGPTGSSTINPFTLTTDHPRVTLLSMVAPSPDWFVGVSGLSLLDAQADWLASLTVNLYPWDAGTEEGTEFSLTNSATSPQETITSLRGMGKFSNEPIATLTFTRQSVNTAPELILEASPAAIVEAGGSAMVTVEITNGVTFAEDQEIALSFAGTATKGTDYTVALESLTLTAEQSSVATTVTAVQDRVDDDAETILITASHGGGTIGTEQTITIIDDDATPAVTTCSGGMAGTYPCSNVDLMSFLALADIGGGSANDIWGWTDSSTGKEYAIMGRTNGTSFVDISDPVNPIYLGNLPPHSADSTWRDIKVYADHAFIVTEATNSGMQVFDLTQLRMVASPPATFSETAHYPDFSDAHNLAINEDSGFAYAVGTNTCSGGLHMINIQTPTNPTSAGCFSGDGYTHDAQCVIYDGPDLDHQGKEICFNSNEDTLTIVDVTNKADPVMLSRTGYSGSRYTHQGWLTEDQGYFLLGDELDEKNNPDVTNTRTYMWNVSDLDGPALIGSHDSTTTAIDHNQYVKGNYTYQSNYHAGLRILDITDIANGNLSEAAFFDFNPGSDPTNVDGGTWSNYPFFDSGIVIVSVIEQGLFILRPNLVDGVNPALASAAVNGAALTLTYGEALDESSTPATDAFTVTVAGSGRTVTHVAVSGRVVTLMLVSAVAHGEAVTVSYSPGTNPIQDAVGNDALGLSNEPVRNATPDTTPPTVSSVGITSDPGPDGIYAIGDVIEVTVRFDETVVVTRTPQLTLDGGGADKASGLQPRFRQRHAGVRLSGGGAATWTPTA